MLKGDPNGSKTPSPSLTSTRSATELFRKTSTGIPPLSKSKTQRVLGTTPEQQADLDAKEWFKKLDGVTTKGQLGSQLQAMAVGQKDLSHSGQPQVQTSNGGFLTVSKSTVGEMKQTERRPSQAEVDAASKRRPSIMAKRIPSIAEHNALQEVGRPGFVENGLGIRRESAGNTSNTANAANVANRTIERRPSEKGSSFKTPAPGSEQRWAQLTDLSRQLGVHQDSKSNIKHGEDQPEKGRLKHHASLSGTDSRQYGSQVLVIKSPGARSVPPSSGSEANGDQSASNHSGSSKQGTDSESKAAKGSTNNPAGTPVQSLVSAQTKKRPSLQRGLFYDPTRFQKSDPMATQGSVNNGAQQPTDRSPPSGDSSPSKANSPGSPVNQNKAGGFCSNCDCTCCECGTKSCTVFGYKLW